MTSLGASARRAALQALLGAAGAGFALPSAAAAQPPMHQHLANAEALERAQQNAAAAASAAAFLDEHQAKTLEALAEAIVPGSTGARVLTSTGFPGAGHGPVFAGRQRMSSRV